MLIRFYVPMHILFQAMPLVGLLAASLYGAHCYRRQKSIPLNRCIYIFVFGMYMLFAYYLIIRPFAGFGLVAAMTTPTTQLQPFRALTDFFENSGFVLTDLSTWKPAFTGRIFRGIVLNILLFVPIGFFLRGVCNQKVGKTLLISFLICLFFELTQLSGLYFIYPRPYRIFDVDDFITNLMGAYLGYLLAPMLLRWLPSPLKAQGRQITLGQEVPLSRRLGAMLIDQGLMAPLALLLAQGCVGVFDGDFLSWSIRDEAAALAAYFLLALGWALGQYLSRGKSLGLWVFGLRLKSLRSAPLRLWQCVVRALVFALAWATPSLMFTLISTVHHRGFHLAPIALPCAAVLLLIEGYLYLSLALGGITRSTRLIYDQWSETRLEKA